MHDHSGRKRSLSPERRQPVLERERLVLLLDPGARDQRLGLFLAPPQHEGIFWWGVPVGAKRRARDGRRIFRLGSPSTRRGDRHARFSLAARTLGSLHRAAQDLWL